MTTFQAITQRANDLVDEAIAQDPNPLTVAVESEDEADTLIGVMIVGQAAIEHSGLEVHGEDWSIRFVLPKAA